MCSTCKWIELTEHLTAFLKYSSDNIIKTFVGEDPNPRSAIMESRLRNYVANIRPIVVIS